MSDMPNRDDGQDNRPQRNAEVASWWAEHPMTYGRDHGGTTYAHGEDGVEKGTLAFFDKVDETFYSWNRPLHSGRPFERIFDYSAYAGKKVLEVGCGMGTMAMNWARAGANVTAVDLNPVAVEMTRRRFALLGLEGRIEQADGTRLPFDDTSFDYIYSWGVLHHSAKLDQSIDELFRVAAPGAGYGVMLYNRRSILHWYMTEFIEGYLHLENRFLGPLALASRYGDGARQEGNPHTWPVTRDEMQALFGRYSTDLDIRTLGTDLENIAALMLPGLGLKLPTWAIKPWARRWGWSLWMHGTKGAR